MTNKEMMLVWFLFKPIVDMLAWAIIWNYKQDDYSKEAKGISALVVMIFNLYIGYILWKG